MGYAIFHATFYFQILMFMITIYYLLISIFGIYKKAENCEIIEPEKSFALVIAAHDEELVIAQIIDSLNNLDYPKDLYDIYVVADNCNDNTAAIAREYGAVVYERDEKGKRGKGYALEWMFNRIFSLDKNYDAVVIFDADNLASRNFLIEINKKMKQGYKVVQGYLDSKNPHDSWISESYSISFWASNRLFQYSRNRLGLSNQIGGTGFSVDTNVLKELGWGATCLTEDLEFTCKLVLNGYKVGWAHEAVIYDEKPLTLSQSWKQRKRWMKGFADVSSRYFLRLIRKAILERDFIALDCALYTIQPFVIVGLGVSTILTLLQNYSSGLNIYVINNLFCNEMVWKTFSIFEFLFTPFIMMLEKKLTTRLFFYLTAYSLNVFVVDALVKDKTNFTSICIPNIIFFILFISFIALIDGRKSLKIVLWYIFYGVYSLTWLPITIQGILEKNNKEWSHTKHTRRISIDDIEEIDERSIA